MTSQQAVDNVRKAIAVLTARCGDFLEGDDEFAMEVFRQATVDDDGADDWWATVRLARGMTEVALKLVVELSAARELGVVDVLDFLGAWASRAEGLI